MSKILYEPLFAAQCAICQMLFYTSLFDVIANSFQLTLDTFNDMIAGFVEYLISKTNNQVRIDGIVISRSVFL